MEAFSPCIFHAQYSQDLLLGDPTFEDAMSPTHHESRGLVVRKTLGLGHALPIGRLVLTGEEGFGALWCFLVKSRISCLLTNQPTTLPGSLLLSTYKKVSLIWCWWYAGSVRGPTELPAIIIRRCEYSVLGIEYQIRGEHSASP